MASRCYAGIDSGGTGTRALLADGAGRVLGTGFSGSANRNHYTRDQVQQNLRDAIRAALSGVPPDYHPSSIFLGMSGVSTSSDCQEIVNIVREIPEVPPQARVAVGNDTVAGLTGGLSGRPGLALIAGTGSACLGVNEQGEWWLCGGWGALADDVGSAPWIGQRALQAAVQAEDGRAAPTALRGIVFDYLGLAQPREFISRVHNQGLERAELGLLAPLVIKAFRGGDGVAGDILSEAAAGLAALVAATARRLFRETPCEMILVGGLARSGPPFQPMLTNLLQQDTPTLRVVEPALSPVHGAVLEAMRADGVLWTEQILANLAVSCTKT